MKRYFEAERMCTRLLNDQPDHPEIVTIRIIRAETLMELEGGITLKRTPKS
jgi:hypothetical protein